MDRDAAAGGGLLDALHDLWCGAKQGLRALSWQDQDWTGWVSGDLVSWVMAFPTARQDRYLLNGRTFVSDEMYCVTPACTCLDARIIFLEVLGAPDTETGERWIEAGSFAIDVGDCRASDWQAERVSLAELRGMWSA